MADTAKKTKQCDKLLLFPPHGDKLGGVYQYFSPLFFDAALFAFYSGTHFSNS